MANDEVNMDWFCGTNYTTGTTGLELNLTNPCFVDFLVACIHTFGLIGASLILLILGCCTRLRQVNPKTLLIFPGHDTRWITFYIFWVVLLAAIGEGILSDISGLSTPTQPNLYVPTTLAFVMLMISMAYYHNMECWSCPSMCWFLVLYWTLALFGEVLKLMNLVKQGYGNFDILRFDIAVICAVIYGFYLLLEINIIRTKILGWCFTEPGYPLDLKKKEMYYYHRYTNLTSRVAFWWLNWLMILGYKKSLDMKDLGVLPDEHGTRFHYELFKNAYEKEKKRIQNKDIKPSLWRTYLTAYGSRMLFAGLLKLVGDTLGFISPVVVGGVVAYATGLYYSPDDVSNDVVNYVTVEDYFANGYVLVIIMFLSATARFACLQYHYYITIIESIHVRTAIQCFVYEKSVHLSSWTMTGGEMTMGQITNHMSVDAIAVHFLFQFGHYLWSVPYQIIVILILLYVELGYAALIGSAVFIISTPIQFKIGASMSKIQKSVLGFSDDRLKKSNELLQGIKLLKLYGWEDIYCKAIETARSKEVRQMLKAGMYMVATMLITQATPIIVTLVSFGVYSIVSPTPLTPEIAFSSLALFNQMMIPLFLLPMIIGQTVNAYVSTNRLQNFFIAPEIEDIEDGRVPLTKGSSADYRQLDNDNENIEPSDNMALYKNSENSVLHHYVEDNDKTKLLDDGHPAAYGALGKTPALADNMVNDLPDDLAIKITNGNFAWDVANQNPTISGIDLEVQRGKLTMVIGLVGSGKSSLLSSMLGEMTTLSGRVQYNRSHSKVSYGAQKAWLMNASLRDNILFGEDYDHLRYQAVVKACALQPDIDILPAGDYTEIGEKGINLSGGQKQRVSVARCIYSHSDIVILDDPLSALDVHVGRQLFMEGIMELLIQNNRTVLLVTHQLQFLKDADKVIVMDYGKIYQQGNLREISAQDPELYANWKETLQLISESESDSEEEGSATMERQKLIKQLSIRDMDGEDVKQSGEADGKLIEKEERERGSVSWKVYMVYARAMRIPIVCLLVSLLLAQVGASVATNFWLSEWSEAGANVTANRTEEESTEELIYYISGYGGLAGLTILLALVYGLCNVIFALMAAKRLHLKLLHNVIHVPMRFYDTTPIGRILNRFSNDTQLIDQRLWQTFNALMRSSLNVLSALVVNTIVIPIFIVIVTPVMIGYYFLQRFFIATSRELQRLDSISKSPVFAHFSETLGGLSTIRAFRDEKRFRKQIVDRIDRNNIAYIYLQTANRWLGIRLDSIGASIVLIAGVACMASASLGALEPSYVGLSITYALQVSGYLNWVVRNSADAEMQMNAIERVDYYSNIPTEQYEGVYKPPKDWPKNGDISIEHISVRYAEDLDPVLHNVSVHFKPGEKVGICGRTGSGKSSLTLALFRVIDMFQGRILIDNVDISHVPLITLRNRIAIIPQDPILFAGTIRHNLDPEDTRTDDELWEALEIAQMKKVVSELDNTLESQVTEGGENFSVGQRQLFCLARAFLRKARILVMDEATASIDMQTDAILQEVVSTAFGDKTVLTIAHRVSTILNSDSILVLSDGKVAEYDTPQNLLRKESSMFSSLVKGSEG